MLAPRTLRPPILRAEGEKSPDAPVLGSGFNVISAFRIGSLNLRDAHGRPSNVPPVRLVECPCEACVSVADDVWDEAASEKGFGLTLIEGLARQLSGRTEYAEVEKGSRVQLCFPVAF
jgi:hypothetical protein